MFPHYWNDQSDTSRDRPLQQRGDIKHQNVSYKRTELKDEVGAERGNIKGQGHNRKQYT